MKRTDRNERIKHLKTNGFKVVKGYSFLYVNEHGSVFSLVKDSLLKPDSRNLISVNGKRLNLPKLILEAYKGIKLSKGKIVYIDGNKLNLNANNLRYARIFKPKVTIEVNQTDLLAAIRCYFEVEKRFKVSNYFLTKFYLKCIAEKRGFFLTNKGKNDIEVFEYYLMGNSIAKSDKKSILDIRDCRLIVYSHQNTLISEVLEDKKQGLLTEKEFIQRKKSKRQIVKQWNDYISTFSQENDVKNNK